MQAIRPSSLDQFVGQDRVRKILSVLIRASKKQSRPVPHILLAGPPGLGKTTLARLISEEVGSRLREVVASTISSPSELLPHLTAIEEGDVVVLDEIHGLCRGTEEVLYGAMEDFKISLPDLAFDGMMKQLGMGNSKPTRNTKSIPRFTLVGATTLSGLVSPPLRSRFVQTLNLTPYSALELAQIAQQTGRAMGITLDDDIAMQIAKRSRESARITVGHVRWIHEYCLADDTEPTSSAVDDAFTLQGIDEEGLTALDWQYLTSLISAGTPLGLSTIASATGESRETLAEAVEPFLLRHAYIRKTPKGRIATPKAGERMALI